MHSARLSRPVWVDMLTTCIDYVHPDGFTVAEVDFVVDHEARKNYYQARFLMPRMPWTKFDSLDEAKRFVENTYELSE